MNQDDKNYITDTVGKEAIKYLESPFGMTMSNITIDGQEMDLSQMMPSYAQVVSLMRIQVFLLVVMRRTKY